MEVESCKVVDALYCIRFNKEYFHIEDVEARKILTLSNTQLRWFLKEISEFLCGPKNGFLLQNGFDEFGSTRLLNFFVKSRLGDEIYSLEEEPENIPSSIFLRVPLDTVENPFTKWWKVSWYLIWYRKHLQTSSQLPSKSLGASYAETVKFNGSSTQELVKQNTPFPVLTSEF